MFRGVFSKEGQHFQRFMLAFHKVCPEAFEELRDSVFPFWREAGADLESFKDTDYCEANDIIHGWLLKFAGPKPPTPKDLGVTPPVALFIYAAVLWLHRYNLLSSPFALELVISTMMDWEEHDDLKNLPALRSHLTPKDLPKRRHPQQPKPPAFNSMNEAKYREAVEVYIRKEKEWRGWQFRNSLPEPKYAAKRNPLHYEWAALYQCLGQSPNEIFRASEDALGNEAELLSYIKRTLHNCLITPRRGRAGRKRNNDALLDT